MAAEKKAKNGMSGGAKSLEDQFPEYVSRASDPRCPQIRYIIRVPGQTDATFVLFNEESGSYEWTGPKSQFRADDWETMEMYLIGRLSRMAAALPPSSVVPNEPASDSDDVAEMCRIS